MATNAFSFQVQWADLDSNQHVGNARYLDYATQARFLFMAAQGFTPERFAQLGVGPVVLEDRVQYRRELRLLDRFEVFVELKAIDEDGSRFVLRNRMVDAAGKACAEVTSVGRWFSLAERRTVTPPPDLLAVLRAMPRAEDFEAL